MHGSGRNTGGQAASGTQRQRSQGGPIRPAYLLLEVVLALAVLVVGLATIGGQIQRSWETAAETHRVLRTMNLAESKLNELEAGLIMNIESAVENDLEEEFGRLFPCYGWRLRLEPTQTPDLWMVRLDILYQQRDDVEEEFDFDRAEVLFTLRTLRATPAKYNFCELFRGVCDGDTSRPGRSAGGDGGGNDGGGDEDNPDPACVLEALSNRGIDPAEVDFRELASRPMDELIGLLTEITACGVQIPLGLVPDDIGQLLQGAGVDGVEGIGGGGPADETAAEE